MSIGINYIVPSVELFEVVSEGVLCASGGGFGAGIEDWEGSEKDFGGSVS